MTEEMPRAARPSTHLCKPLSKGRQPHRLSPRACPTAVRFNFYGPGAWPGYRRVIDGSVGSRLGLRHARVSRRCPRRRPVSPTVTPAPGSSPGVFRGPERHCERRGGRAIREGAGTRMSCPGRKPGRPPGTGPGQASDADPGEAGRGRCPWLWTPEQVRGDTGAGTRRGRSRSRPRPDQRLSWSQVFAFASPYACLLREIQAGLARIAAPRVARFDRGPGSNFFCIISSVRPRRRCMIRPGKLLFWDRTAWGCPRNKKNRQDIPYTYQISLILSQCGADTWVSVAVLFSRTRAA